MTGPRRLFRTMVALGALLIAVPLAGCATTVPTAPAASAAAPVGAATGTHVGRPMAAHFVKPLVFATLGDSITFGRGLTPAEAWPALVAGHHGWTLTNAGCSGAGFVHVGWPGCGGTFAGEVPRIVAAKPDLLLIQASRNDLGQPDDRIRAAAISTLDRLRQALPRTRFVGINAVWNDTAQPAQLADINARMRDAVIHVGGTYLDCDDALHGRRDLLQPDDIHPTAAGQVALADAITRALTAARIGS